MKYLVSALVLSVFGFVANAAQNGRPAMSNHIMSAPRYTASVNQISNVTSIKNPTGAAVVTPVVAAEEEVAVEEEKETPKEPEVDRRDAERNACISNNIGMGNTFVWASKFSDTSSYTNMVEDAEHPENNVCFVRVELASSNESRIKVSDIEPKYFMWDETIKCGSWVSKKEMEKRILDAKKGVRIGGIVASTVGGMGLGVGAMELFGNKLIGGKVEGQKSVKKETLYKNKLVDMNKKGGTEIEQYKKDLDLLVKVCDSGNVFIDNCSLYKDLRDAIK